MSSSSSSASSSSSSTSSSSSSATFGAPDDISERLFVDRVVFAIMKRMKTGEVDCYASLQAMYIEGQSPRVIQVIPGSVDTVGAPDGGQVGGYLHRRMSLDIVLWWRTHIDAFRRSDLQLTEAAYGILDYMTNLREIFEFTTLGFLVRPIFYEGETDTVWYDIDRHVARRTLRISGEWIVAWPETMTETTWTS